MAWWIVLGLMSLRYGSGDAVAAQIPPGDSSVPDIEVFVQAGCPHCARAEAFLDSLQHEHPNIRVVIADVSENRDALARLVELARLHDITPVAVPAFYIRGRLSIGYLDDETTGREIVAALGLDTIRVDSALDAPNPSIELLVGPADTAFTELGEGVTTVTVPVFGALSVERVGLPLFTLAIGLIDGLNPCAMWALVYLLSLLAGMQDRGRMLIVAGTFVAVGGVIYFAFIAAWLEAFILIGFSRPIQFLLGGFALVAGGLNLKDFVSFGAGPTLSIPSSAKPTIYAHMRRVISARNLTGAVLAVAILASLINLVELLCTAGLPAVYTQILTGQGLGRGAYYGYLALYIGAYVFDDSIVLALAVLTLSRQRMQERSGRMLKLLSGAVMLLLGLALIFTPDLLF